MPKMATKPPTSSRFHFVATSHLRPAEQRNKARRRPKSLELKTSSSFGGRPTGWPTGPLGTTPKGAGISMGICG